MFLRLGEGELTLKVLIAGLELFEGDCLACRFCAECAQRVGDRFAILLVALRHDQYLLLQRSGGLRTHISLQDQVMHEIDYLRHCDFLSAPSP